MASPTPSPTLKRKKQGPYSDGAILEIARCQKAMNWVIPVAFAGTLAGFAFPPILLLTALIMPFFVFRLAFALRSSIAILYGLFALVPFLGLLVLLSVSGQATTALKDRGIRVGLFGAKAADLRQLENEILEADSGFLGLKSSTRT